MAKRRLFITRCAGITTDQAAIIALRVTNHYVGNLAPMPGVLQDFLPLVAEHEPLAPLHREDLDLLEIQDRWFAEAATMWCDQRARNTG